MEIGKVLLLQRAFSPLFLLLLEARSDAAHRVLADLHPAQCFGDASYLPDRDPREVHLKDDRLFDVPGHALVSLKYLRYERSEEHTSELQSRQYLVCRLL